VGVKSKGPSGDSPGNIYGMAHEAGGHAHQNVQEQEAVQMQRQFAMLCSTSNKEKLNAHSLHCSPQIQIQRSLYTSRRQEKYTPCPLETDLYCRLRRSRRMARFAVKTEGSADGAHLLVLR